MASNSSEPLVAAEALVSDAIRSLGHHPSSLQTHTIRILPCMEIYSTLQDYVSLHGLRSAFVITAVGSVTKATLRYAHVPGGGEDSNRIVTHNRHMEIVSFVGTISAGSHLHICLSDHEGRMIGGHVMGDLLVFTTCEVVIGESINVEMTRPFDPATGFPELKMKDPAC